LWEILKPAVVPRALPERREEVPLPCGEAHSFPTPKMRIGIREQLAAAVLLCSILPLVILSVAVWINNHSFVVAVTGNELTLTASLKAAEIASDLVLIQSTCSTIVTRILLQQTLVSFYKDQTTNFSSALDDVKGALLSGGFSSLLQTEVFSRNGTGG